MLVLEFRAYGKSQQFIAIEEAIRTVQFIRNKCIRLWIDNPKTSKYDLSKYSAILAKEFSFANKLNAMSRQASAERAWAAISRFFDNCKKRLAPVGFPDAKSETRQKGSWEESGKRGLGVSPSEAIFQDRVSVFPKRQPFG